MKVIKPIVHETIWGGSNLTPFSGTDCQKIGHLYSFVDTDDFQSEFVDGGTLHDWFMENRAKYGLEKYIEVPILGAMLDAADDLSIQVHPDDEHAQKLENKPFGKNESFFTLKAPTCGKMYNGCRATSVDDMKEKIASGKIAETLDMLPCAAGDYCYIVGGTLHAATAGSMHFEIEENCEKTYRFYDFDRIDKNGNKRPLQLDKALACLDVTKKSTSRKYNDDEPIVERMYASRHLVGKPSFTNVDNMFSFAVMLAGDKMIAGHHILPGTAILLDAGETLDTSNAEWLIATPRGE